jgi:cation diffusion facilitator family transporter
MDYRTSKTRVALLSVASNSVLVVGKLLVGLLIGSVSVISEAIHSGMDLVAALIALFAVRTSSKPPDREHPYGHGKIENISGAVEAVLILVAAIWIIYESALKLITREPIDNALPGVLIMALSATLNHFVSGALFKVGKATDSVALMADAWHLRTDVWTSLGVLGALGVITLGQLLFPALSLWWIDPIAALAVALLILRTSWDLSRQALYDVMDRSLPEDELEWIRCQILGCQLVINVHDLRTRKAGAQRFVEFHLMVDPDMKTVDSHRITDDLTARICSRFPCTTITAHVEPFEEDHEETSDTTQN